MTPPQDPDPVDALLAHCLAADDQAGALAAASAAHPQHAAALRGRYAFLCRAGAVSAPRTTPPAPLDRLGGFRLQEPLGGGGMGVVYAAVAEASGAAAAVKLVRPEWLWFPGARERFAREIEAVQRLDHPGIVRILAHDLEGAVPWFAMERVAGRSLGAVLAAHRGADPSRLPAADLRQPAANWAGACVQVAAQVAQALAHAHAHAIVHRDVKPSNVMLGDDGRVRLIDFGLASVAATESLTRTGVQPGSLAYMSPEQARGEEVDARTDVWSLGVLLYELLTLHQPFVRATEAATRQAILMASVPSRRGLGAGGDARVDAILATAMAPERERRYPDMAAFADDLRACAAGTAVGARRPGALLRARRWVQRHPARTVSLALAGVVLGVLPTVLLLQERAARERIEREATRAHAALQFLEDLFYEAEPRHSRGDKTPVRVLLQRGLRRLRGELAGGPEMRAALLHTLGSAVANIGLGRDAEPLLREALALAPANTPAERSSALATRERLAQVLSDQERHAEAEVEHRALAAAHAAAGDAAAAALARVGLAGDLWRQDKVADAQREYDAALADLARLLPADDRRLLRARRDRAAFLHARVDSAAALAELRLVHARLAATLPADDATLLQTTELLAGAELEQDRPRDAAERLRAAEAVAAGALDPEHPILAALRVQLALALQNLGQPREGLGHLQAALAAYRATHGDDHPLVARTRHHESHLAFEAGDLELAAAAAEHAIAVYEKTAPGGSHDFAVLLGNLARVETLLGRPAQGQALAQRALAMHETVEGSRSQHAALTLSFLAYCDALLGDLPAAKTHGREACALAAQGGNARSRFLTATYLADILLIDGATTEAAEVIERARQEQARLGSAAGQATLLGLNGWLRHQRGEHDAAERDLLAALEVQQQYGPDHPYRARTLGYLGAVHVAQKRWSEAIARLQEALVIRRAAGTDLYALYPLSQLTLAHMQAGDDAAAWDCGKEVLAILRRQEAPQNRMVRPALQLLAGVASLTKDPATRDARVQTLVEATRELLPERDGMRLLVERLARSR